MDAAIGVGGAVAAVPAQAGAVHVEAVASAASQGEYVVFTAAPGERNRVTVRYRAVASVRVQDTVGVQAGESCTAESPNARNVPHPPARPALVTSTAQSLL